MCSSPARSSDFWRTQCRWGWWFEAIWSLRIGEVSGRAGGWLHAKKPKQNPYVICFPKSSPGNARKSWIISMTFLEFQWIADVSLAPRPFFTWLLRSLGCVWLCPHKMYRAKNTAQLGQFGDLKAAQKRSFFGVFSWSFLIYTRSSMGMPWKCALQGSMFRNMPLDMGVWSPSWCFTQWKLKMRDPHNS